MADTRSPIVFPHRHLLGIEALSAPDILHLLDMAEEAVALSRQVEKKRSVLRGRTQINLFFENSTRTQASFEIAGKRLGADVMNMSVANSSVKKGETLIDTAVTLNAMRPDIIIVRHQESGAVDLLARKVDCSVVNAGDGAHQHPTQALLDALTIRRNKGRIEGLTVAICGDVAHSRVARSNMLLLAKLGARVRVVAPSTLLPAGVERLGVEAVGFRFVHDRFAVFAQRADLLVHVFQTTDEFGQTAVGFVGHVSLLSCRVSIDAAEIGSCLPEAPAMAAQGCSSPPSPAPTD